MVKYYVASTLYTTAACLYYVGPKDYTGAPVYFTGTYARLSYYTEASKYYSALSYYTTKATEYYTAPNASPAYNKEPLKF